MLSCLPVIFEISLLCRVAFFLLFHSLPVFCFAHALHGDMHMTVAHLDRPQLGVRGSCMLTTD